MTYKTKPTRYRHRAVFVRTTKRTQTASSKSRKISAGQVEPDSEEVISSDSHIPTRPQAAPMIPDVFCSFPPVRDSLETETSVAQDDVVETCLPFMSGQAGSVKLNEHGVAHLARKNHAQFLSSILAGLPAPFVAADASRPWFFYWCLNGLSLLGEDVSSYSETLIATARSIQNPAGGFGGGFGQTSHLATTYAMVLSLALVGGEDCFEVLDRRSLWKWLSSLKQPDGGFRMSSGGEEDIRGAYCAAVIIALLNLPIDLTRDSPAWTADGSTTLLTGLGDYVRSCQTFEGGISAAPDAEAHGAYAFCALGCLSIIGPPDQMFRQYLDLPRFISWLSSRQYGPEGGFSGRTNKLVDGCYSHWVGGCWPLIEASLNNITLPKTATSTTTALPSASQTPFSREGLIRYILCCCQDQSKRGGLRDKPGRPSDAYHSCYVLSGLSAAQNKWELVPPRDQPMKEEKEEVVVEGDTLEWMVSPYLDEAQIFDSEDHVRTIHPVYAIPEQQVKLMKAFFTSKPGF